MNQPKKEEQLDLEIDEQVDETWFFNVVSVYA